MYAIIRTGGKQYQVEAGDTLRVEKLLGEVGDTVELSDVLLLVDGETVKIGQPVVDGAKVVAKMKEMPINDMFAKGGKIREDGRMVHDMYLVQVKKPSESKAPWDYYKIISTIPGDQAFRPLSEGKCPLVKS